MIKDKKILGVIPARGGSKEVPRKNIREVRGKPLIAYTISAARCSRLLDRLVVSSEDQEILAIANACGAETLLRPQELAMDDSPGIDTVLHSIKAYQGYDYVILLQPTSPMRSTRDIDAAIRLCSALKAPACVSVCKAESSPFWMFFIDTGMKMTPLIAGPIPDHRHELPTVYKLNGAIYIAEVNWLEVKRDFIADETIAYVMPNDRSVDIDTETDLQFFQEQLQKI